jgi:hypothetical protein
MMTLAAELRRAILSGTTTSYVDAFRASHRMHRPLEV